MRSPLTLVLIVLKVLALCATCYGQPVVRLKQTVQRCELVRCVQTEVGWSGVIVGRIKDGRVAVLTCAHTLKAREDFYKTPYVEIDGAWLPGSWKAWHPQRDVGLIVVTTTARVKCLPIATTDAPVGSEITLYGFANSEPAVSVRPGKIASATPDWLRMTSIPTQGMSGGPVLHDGQVVGLITGYSRHGLGAWGGDGPTLAMIRKSLIELAGEVPVCGTVEPAPPITPTPIEQPQPYPELKVVLDRIEARLEALEKRGGTPGPAGPSGDRGPAGPPGKPGGNADVSSLESRLKKLEGVQIPVELLDANGKTVDSMKVNLGDPIRLKLLIRDSKTKE